MYVHCLLTFKDFARYCGPDVPILARPTQCAFEKKRFLQDRIVRPYRFLKIKVLKRNHLIIVSQLLASVNIELSPKASVNIEFSPEASVNIELSPKASVNIELSP